jgi:hypothetical protein
MQATAFGLETPDGVAIFGYRRPSDKPVKAAVR